MIHGQRRIFRRRKEPRAEGGLCVTHTQEPLSGLPYTPRPSPQPAADPRRPSAQKFQQPCSFRCWASFATRTRSVVPASGRACSSRAVSSLASAARSCSSLALYFRSTASATSCASWSLCWQSVWERGHLNLSVSNTALQKSCQNGC